ncbi:hypothetical protein HanXRQr2_Chr06g0255421 [Helianthus annuus]|uniref:Uncharacterized protein n=1 Tax=Helianthus annuus TaxID=4232 RepID=A0A9K3IS81_HELAN|nr:hypothetical protein HanXRQr2_Chr06g0255421 [Helianthus annuus]KAJ0915146.1 hypothetical protein HanPSC8_Chr06g0246601 [Helianthus annuus]
MELNWKKSTGTSPRYAAHELVSSATRLRILNEVGPDTHPRDTQGDMCFLSRLAGQGAEKKNF